MQSRSTQYFNIPISQAIEEVKEWLTEKHQENEHYMQLINKAQKTNRYTKNREKVYTCLIEKNIQIDELLKELNQPWQPENYQ